MSAARQRFLEAAARIGRRLCRDAVWHDGRCNWLGWAMEPHGGQWVSAYRAMGVSVYDGSAGIGLFLARLARLSDDPIIAATAVGALAQALATVEEQAATDYGPTNQGPAAESWQRAEDQRSAQRRYRATPILIDPIAE